MVVTQVPHEEGPRPARGNVETPASRRLAVERAAPPAAADPDADAEGVLLRRRRRAAAASVVPAAPAAASEAPATLSEETMARMF